MKKVFTNIKDHTKTKAFLDQQMGIQRYDVVKYLQFEKFTDKQLGFFWRPQEIDLSKDAKDFKDLTVHEKHIFTSNLKRQILLDSVQGRSPNLAFLPLVSLPELEAWIETWSFNELIHSRSYTHIIRNIYADPSVILDDVCNIKEIIECADDISEHYNNLLTAGLQYNLLGVGVHTVNGKKVVVDKYDIKKKLWLAIMSVNILEGIRFYVSFACSWAFAELKSMEGNAKIIKLICRDENVHLGSTQVLLKLLQQDDRDFKKIAKETKDISVSLFEKAVEQEKAWAAFLFQDGSMIGLNEKLLTDYIEWIANKRMLAVGLPSPYTVPQANPLPWTQKWISGAEVQIAPQEVEISSYIIGGTKQDVDDNTFKGISL